MIIETPSVLYLRLAYSDRQRLTATDGDRMRHTELYIPIILAINCKIF
jgi:hypothetical protein